MFGFSYFILNYNLLIYNAYIINCNVLPIYNINNNLLFINIIVIYQLYLKTFIIPTIHSINVLVCL